MAGSGSFNTGAYSGRYLQFAWTARTSDIVNNKTTIDWTLKGAGGSSSWYMSGNFKVVIDGVQERWLPADLIRSNMTISVINRLAHRQKPESTVRR